MKLLRCKICYSEVDIVDNEFSVVKKTKCRKCNYSNETEKGPEVFVIRKKVVDEAL